jgi:TonB family protein
MSNLFKRKLKFSTLVHLCALLALMVGSMVSSCTLLRKPKDDITVIDLTVALPMAPEEEASPAPEPKAPEPPAAPPPTPPVKAPEPSKSIPDKSLDKPESKPAPTPAKKNTVERSTNRVVRKSSDIPYSKTPPKGPVLSPDQIKKLLAAGARISDTTSVPDNWQETGYYQKIGDRIQRVWASQSDSVPPGYSGQVVIRVQRNGSIAGSSIKQSSGNSAVDASLMKAVRTITKVDPLPSSISGSPAEIVVYFDTDRLSGI